MKLKDHNKFDLRIRINKGLAMLDPAHKILFTAWCGQRVATSGRAIAKFRKDDLIASFLELADLYRRQVALASDEKFEHKTSPWIVQVRNRAARIRDASQELRTLVMQSAPIEKIKAAKLRIKTAQAT